MRGFFIAKNQNLIHRIPFCICVYLLAASLALSPAAVYAQSALNLPAPGTMVQPSPAFTPPLITGINIYPDNPVKFDFIIDPGDSYAGNEAFEAESGKLINYFLAALTVEEDQMWVNLSPYEKNRIIPEGFGRTEMGRDLLAQDYLLKQLAASLLYPEEGLGQNFWRRIRQKMSEELGSDELPADFFNKVWIVPDHAKVAEHSRGAYVVQSSLKVMLEQDYLALESNQQSTRHGLGSVSADNLSRFTDAKLEIIREMILPEIEKEVNQGKNFTPLRQIYNAVILAAWYKQALKQSVLGQIYVDQNKTGGIQIRDTQANQKIYGQYLEAFKTGVYNYIKEDIHPQTGEIIPRKYFSGGVNLLTRVDKEAASSPVNGNGPGGKVDRAMIVRIELKSVNSIGVQLKDVDGDKLKEDLLARMIVFESKQYDSDPTVRLKAGEELAKIYGEMVQSGLMTREELQWSLRDSRYNVRLETAKVLGQMDMLRIRNGEDVDLNVYTALLGDHVDDNRAGIIKVIGELNEESVRQGRAPDLSALEEQLNGRTKEIKEYAAEALAAVYAEMVRKGTMTLAEFEHMLISEDVQIRRAVLSQLSNIYKLSNENGWSINVTAVEGLIDEKLGIGQPAVGALKEAYISMVSGGAMLLEELKKKLDHPKAGVAIAAIGAFKEITVGQIGQGQNVNYMKLVNKLGHPDALLRSAVIEALGGIYAAMVKKGSRITLARLESLLDDPDPDIRIAAAAALGKIYQEMIKKSQTVNLTRLKTLMDSGSQESWYIAPVLAADYAEQVRAGMISADQFKDLLKDPNRRFVERMIAELGPMYVYQMEQGVMPDLTVLEDLLRADQPYFIYHEAGQSLVTAYRSAVRSGLMTPEFLESRLSEKRQEVHRALVLALGLIYEDMAADGQRADLTSMKDQLYDAEGKIRPYVFDVIGRVLLVMSEHDLPVDLTVLERGLSDGSQAVQRSAIGNLGSLYAGMIKNGRYGTVNRRAYEFWKRNGLSFDEPSVNMLILSHLFQLDDDEFDKSQEWISQLIENAPLSTDFAASIFYLELLIPGSSAHVEQVLENGGIKTIQDLSKILVNNEMTETLLYAKEHIPHIEVQDLFILMEFLSTFSFLGKTGQVREQMDQPFNSRSHLYRLLSLRIVDAFDEVNKKNPDDMKFNYFNKALEMSSEWIKPYIVRAGLRSKDRFTRREAARKARSIQVVTDALKDDLVRVLSDTDLNVVENAAESLGQIGDERIIVRLNSILHWLPEQVVLYIFDDHGSVVAYTEKVEMTGITSDLFKFKEERVVSNPEIPIMEKAIAAIERRIAEHRKSRKMDISRIEDKRLVKFFEFLKQHGLEDFIVVVGGGVRDSFMGRTLNDIDINVRIPLSEEDHRGLLPTMNQANERIYSYAVEKLALLADALKVDVQDFLPPTSGKTVMWEGVEIQYTGPVILKQSEDEGKPEKSIYLKRIIVGDNGWVYSSNSGAAILQMAMDSEGNIYGHSESLDDLRRGVLRIAGNRDNLAIGDVLRMMILKYEFRLYISQEDYELIEGTIQKYQDGTLQLPPGVMKDIVLTQLKKVVDRAQHNAIAIDELKKLGIMDLVREKLGIESSMLGDTKGGIDLNPEMIDLELQQESGGVFQAPVATLQMLDQYRGISGFVPNIIEIAPVMR